MVEGVFNRFQNSASHNEHYSSLNARNRVKISSTMSNLLSQHILGSILVRYIQPENSKRCELLLIPLALEDRIVTPRRYLDERAEVASLPEKFHPVPADSPHSLVQLKLREDNTGDGFSSGVTMVESGTMKALDYIDQTKSTRDGITEITTLLRDQTGRFSCKHHLIYREGESGIRCFTEFTNASNAPLTLELLSSFALNSITPFTNSNSTPHLLFHRFRSWWSLEGRLDSTSLESLHMERSWGGFATFSERFGQVGSMPVRHWFPMAAIEDKTMGVVWAAQLAIANSWQMELVRRGDRVTLCGGQADREFGHWSKSIKPGETFASAEAYLTATQGTLDQACQALLDGQRVAASGAPEIEKSLPVCFNEWCTSWGAPNHENVIAIAKRLQGTGIEYFVIDDGWAERPPEAIIQNNGEWVVDQKKFPGGLKPTCDALRKLGFTPGIWFEMEVVNPGGHRWEEHAHLVQRDARTLQVGSRRFWNFNDPWVDQYLTEKVIHLLRDTGIGYLKVDYNDNLGMGCDHPDSLGEGLRLHIEGVQRFFRKIRQEIPEIVIENCSSGGHRLEPSMQAVASMGSFSDAHEGTIIPIIARNLQRLILPRQSLIWAVLHPKDDEARLHYSLAATFLGRVCLSGDIHNLSDPQIETVKDAIRLYKLVSTIIDHGFSYFQGTPDGSYVDPKGWQAVIRIYEHQALVVAHGFELANAESYDISLPMEKWKLSSQFAGQGNQLEIVDETSAKLTLQRGFQGGVWLLNC